MKTRSFAWIAAGLALAVPVIRGAVTPKAVGFPNVIYFSDPTYLEFENAHGGMAVITVQRSVVVPMPASVKYFTDVSGTATPGADFLPVNGVIQFSPTPSSTLLARRFAGLGR